MEIFGIGPLEFFFIIVLAVIILGPKDLEKAGKSIGRSLTKLVKSDTWKTVRQASQKVRSFPNELMREAGMEDLKQSLDSEIIPSVKQPRISLESLTSDSRILETATSEKDSAEGLSVDSNQIIPAISKRE
jgi:Sec-independent protein translocase protein TatA